MLANGTASLTFLLTDSVLFVATPNPRSIGMMVYICARNWTQTRPLTGECATSELSCQPNSVVAETEKNESTPTGGITS